MIGLIALLCWLRPCWGNPTAPPSDVAPPPSQSDVSNDAVSIQDMVRMAVQDNLDLQVARTDVTVAQYQVMQERGAFDHVLSAQVVDSAVPSGVNPVVNQLLNLNGANASVGLTQKMMNGSTWTISYQALGQTLGLPSGVTQAGPIITIQPFDTFTNAGAAVLSLEYPLMRGAGVAVNTARMRIAQNNVKIASLMYSQKAEEMAADVARTAWNVVGAQRLHAIEMAGLDQSKRYLSMLDQRVKAGASAPYERYFAIQSEAIAESTECRSRRDVANSTNNLRRLVHNLPSHLEVLAESHFDDIPRVSRRVRRTALVSSTSNLLPPGTDLQDPMVQEAIQNRPEMKRLELAVSNADIQQSVDQNGLKPQLDITGNVGTGYFGGNLWQVGILFQQPLENRSARAALQVSRLRAQQAQLALQQMEQQIASEVSQARATVDSAADNVTATRRARQAAEKQVVAERERFSAGLSPAVSVYEAQQRLLESQRAEVQATIDYETALIDLDRCRGRSLEKYHLALVPLNPATPH
ncbi:MAG: TolC family protein [Candidatus Xenobia bacterium]